MGRSRIQNFSRLPKKIQKKEKDIETKLASINNSINRKSMRKNKYQHSKDLEQLIIKRDEIIKDQEKLVEQIRINYPKYYNIKYPSATSFLELQKNVINQNEILLIYGILEDINCLWVINKKQLKFYKLDFSKEQLENDVIVLIDRIKEIQNSFSKKSNNLTFIKEIRQSEIIIKKLSKKLYELLFPKCIIVEFSVYRQGFL